MDSMIPGTLEHLLETPLGDEQARPRTTRPVKSGGVLTVRLYQESFKKDIIDGNTLYLDNDTGSPVRARVCSMDCFDFRHPLD